MSVYESINSYDPSRSFNTWIRKIATNKAIDVYRRSESRIRKHFEFQEPKGTTPFEDQIMQEESYERTLHEISKLSRGDNEIINLKMRGLSYEQISRELQVPMGTVKSRLHTIRNNLENKLQDN